MPYHGERFFQVSKYALRAETHIEGGKTLESEKVINPDLSSDIIKSIPHFYVLGIRII